MASRRPSTTERLLLQQHQPNSSTSKSTVSLTTDRLGPARDVAMLDSWSHGNDRRDRGRFDRGGRRSASPPSRDRRPSPRRASRESRDRISIKSRSAAQSERPRDRSPERRRRASRSPPRDSRSDVRERNRGRELLDTRGPERSNRSATHTSPSSVKRRKSRSPSPRGHKKSRREFSRSPSRSHQKSAPFSKADKQRRPLSPVPPRRHSPDRRPPDIRSEGKQRNRERDASDRRDRSLSPRRDRREPLPKSENPRRDRSPPRSSQKPRERSPFDKHKEDRAKDQKRDRSPFERPRIKEQQRERSPLTGRRSPSFDRSGPRNRSRQPSPRGSKFKKDQRGGRSPRGDRGGRRGSRDDFPRDDFRPGKGKQKSGKPLTASGANSIEVKGLRASASGANSIEVKSDKMYSRGNFYGHGYNANPMQAAFPLKPQYNQGPPVDPRQYSQSPQHQMTPNSYHSPSPAAQSPYSAGRGNYGQQQFSPQPQYPQNYQQHQQPPQPQPQPIYPTGPQNQNHYYNQAQSPPYQTPSGPMNAQYPPGPQGNFRGNQRAFRGNNQFSQRGGRGDHRGGRGGHFQNQQWNAQPGVGRGQQNTSGNVTPQHTTQQGSPPQQFPQNSGSRAASVVGSQAGSQAGTPQHKPSMAAEEEEDEDLFRPSKELQVEDKEATKKKDEEKMPPPPSRPIPTGPQSQQNVSKFSFTLSSKSKVLPTAPKLEISQKLNAGPVRNVQFSSPDRPRGPNSRSIPTEPASARQNFREPPAPTSRKVKKIMKREKERPQLTEDFKNSDSVYYRKPGNESVVGSGTYGKVFKAVHVFTKSLVALKKIRMEGERDGFPVTAVREIKLLQSLKHANIVNMQEVMVEKNDCFMVFEYLSHDLTGLLNHPTFKLEAAHKKHLAKQLFEGLDYLHRRGVLHRDIKAANILVSNEGQLKIADFGLARFYAKRRQLDYTNRVITIWYRSPELLLGETQYGPAVDIWSAACVLGEIFTRHAIFPGDGTEMSQLEKIYAILGTPTKTIWPGLTDMAWFALLRPNARRPSVFADKYKERVTPAAYDLLEAMLQYDPDKRPSASDVLEHPYFTTEEPKARQATELALLEGDWHEFESKALRKENERKDKEARRQVQKEKDAAAKAEKKRLSDESATGEPDAKRVQIAQPGDAVSTIQSAVEGGK
ncbi:related to cell division protein kinase 2 [Rhynchosporium graminicola]|uniref:cyclin-dependent kinase n=1 Tax=Rhynchosporium graminicola TaxID=2792576 RepID=A0A1E1KNF6_9HELO|nr:related to cell division protein kinase 2 [Rhynchosporium commune]